MMNGAIGPTADYLSASSASANFAAAMNPNLSQDFPAMAVGALIEQSTARLSAPLTISQEIDEIGAALAHSGITNDGGITRA